MTLDGLFGFHVSPVELVVRGSLMYWFLFLMFRFLLRRDAGAVGIADILLVVLVADASQNAMAGSYDTVSEGALLVATLIAWNYALDWASYRFPLVAKFVQPPPLLLIDRGRILKRNLREEFLTREDLEAQLRLNGIESLAEVKRAYMESDGKFSVVRFDRKARPPKADQGRRPGA